MTTAMQAKAGNVNDLHSLSLDGYRMVKVKSSKSSFTLASDHAAVASQDMSQAWNERMDALGAERGSWEELEALLPSV